MQHNIDPSRLLSHNVSHEALEITIENVTDKIINRGDLPHASVELQLDLLGKLTQFDFGRFLLQHRGMNGYWTHYVLTYPFTMKKIGKNNRGEPLSDFERSSLERFPAAHAGQERFQIFLDENQTKVKNNAKLACIPCGMMGELLYLNFDDISSIHLFGIDYDPSTLKDAQALANSLKLSKFTKFIQRDAWNLSIYDEFDLISSNGLTVYEQDDNRVVDLYKQFHNALKPGGKLVTSFATHPPFHSDQCEWDTSAINNDDLILQRIIFIDIVDVKWQCFRSSTETKSQLEAAGFNDIHFLNDKARMSPTVVAYK